jgi:hypothetical protein
MNGINRVQSTSPQGRKEVKMGKNTVKRHRSAVTGKYVSDEYAKKHPKTTVTETDKKKTPNKK